MKFTVPREVIFILIGAIVSLAALIGGSVLIHYRFDLSAQINNKTNGTVTAIACKYTGETCNTEITYTANDGYNYTLVYKPWWWDKSDKVGNVVAVSYRKNDPRNAARNENNAFIIAWGVILVIIGIIGIFVVYVALPSKKAIHSNRTPSLPNTPRHTVPSFPRRSVDTGYNSATNQFLMTTLLLPSVNNFQ